MAEILGYNPIFVLGLDCRADGPFLENFHDAYPQGWQCGAANAISWKSDFEHWVYPNCHAQVINVVNPAYESAVECWPKISLEDFVSYDGDGLITITALQNYKCVSGKHRAFECPNGKDCL